MIATAQAAEATRVAEQPRTTPLELGSLVERDRRAGSERIIELGRWVILIFLAVTTNFPAPTTPNIKGVNSILVGWAVFNLAVTVALVTRHVPGRRIQYAMTALDVTVATGLVMLTGGFASNVAITFYAVVVASSIRFGLLGSLTCVLVVSMADLLAGASVVHAIDQGSLNLYLSHLFMYLLLALTSSLLARELVRARARQMEHTYRLEHAAFFELREVDKLKSEFIMLASHELRTPLAKVKAWLSLMRDAGDRLPPEAHAEGLEVLRTESEHLARLTDNLLCIAQLEAGEIRLKTGPVSLTQVFEQVVSRYVAADQRARIGITIEDDARMVLADRERLSLALACLIDNALKFSADHEPISVTGALRGTQVRLEVHDNGRRIPLEQRDRVFQSFYQLESPLLRQRGGAGVGLYLARQLVERMGGRIWIEGEKVHGNTFCLTLPADL